MRRNLRVWQSSCFPLLLLLQQLEAHLLQTIGEADLPGQIFLLAQLWMFTCKELRDVSFMVCSLSLDDEIHGQAGNHSQQSATACG